MPPKASDNGPSLEVRRGESDGLVHFGVVYDGAFHPFYTERQGDYDERVRAAAETEEEG